MSFSVDVNVLVYASDSTCAFHAQASAFLREAAQSSEIFYLTWPVVIGYLRVSTHPRIFAKPLTPEQAQDNVQRLVDLDQVRLLGPAPDAWTTYRHTCAGQHVRGNLVPDAHIAAVLSYHGVRRFFTRDRDFRRFDALEVIDPFA